MEEVVYCKNCKYGNFVVPCKEAKRNHDLLKYTCKKLEGIHDSAFFCGYAIKKESK